MSSDRDSALQVLLDKQAISEVLIRYARACDRCDEAMLRSCFHPDSVHRHGRFEGSSSDFVDFAMQIIRGTILERHLMTNIMIEVAGERAVSECYYLAYHRQRNPETKEPEDYFQGGRFVDRLEKRNGEWRISARIGLVDFDRFDPVSERFPPQLEPRALSQRAPKDELYALMPSLRKRA